MPDTRQRGALEPPGHHRRGYAGNVLTAEAGEENFYKSGDRK